MSGNYFRPAFDIYDMTGRYEAFYYTLNNQEKSQLDKIFEDFEYYFQLQDSSNSTNLRFVNDLFENFRNNYLTYQYFNVKDFFRGFQNVYENKRRREILTTPNNVDIPHAVPFVNRDRDHDDIVVNAEMVQHVDGATADIIANAEVTNDNSQPVLTATPVRHVQGYAGGRRKSRRNRKSNRKTPQKNVKKSKRQHRRR